MISTLAPPHAARLLVLAARNVGTLRGLYDPAQERDDSGKWTTGGGVAHTSEAVGFDKSPWTFERYKNAPDLRSKIVSMAEVRRIREDLKSQGRLNADGRTISLFHTTLSEPQDILDRGLVPGAQAAAGQDWKAEHSGYATYFHSDRSVAERDTEFGGHVIEVRIPITPKNLIRFLPDEDVSTNIHEGVKTLLEGGPVAFIGGVPPSALRLVATREHAGAPLQRMRHNAFNPDQARDDHGRWTGGAGDVYTGSDSAKIEAGRGQVTARLHELEVAGADDPANHEFAALAHMETAIDYQQLAPLSRRQYIRSAYVFEGDTIVAAGVARMSKDKTTAEILNVGSVKRGAGAAVMASLHAQLKDAGVKQVELLSTSRAFYERQGYSSTGSSIMRRTLEFNPDQPRDEAGKWSGGGSTSTPVAQGVEYATQVARAAAQTNPLAHPDFVIGGSNNPATHRYVAAYGEAHTPAPLPADIEQGTPRECYKNASLLVMGHPELTYAEGFAKSDRTGEMVFQHAWAVTKDGTVVDPTWDNPEKGQYFGVRYERAAYLKYLYTAKIYGVLGSTEKNVRMAVATGAPKLRALAFNPDQPRDEHGRWTDTGGGHGTMLGRPASDYTPSRPDGLDTRERFSDGHGHYTSQRAALHEEIIAKHMAGATPVKNPTVTVLGGAPGVGKSTTVKNEGIGGENTVLINPDDIRNDLPEYAPDATGRRPALTAFTHEEASDISAKMIKRAAAESKNAVLDGTGDSSIEKLGGKVAVLRSKGARVEAVYVTTSVEVAQMRADARSNNPASSSFGRVVPPTAMREMHRAVSRVFPEAIRQGLFDRARLFDSTAGHKLVASAEGRKLTIHDQAAWDAFIGKGQ